MSVRAETRAQTGHKTDTTPDPKNIRGATTAYYNYGITANAVAVAGRLPAVSAAFLRSNI